MKIKSITPLGIRIPMIKPIKMAGIVITDAESLVVRIEDTDGNIGWGESTTAPTMTGETVESMVAAVKFMMPQTEGFELEDPSEFFQHIHPLMIANEGAKAAMDSAVYDIFGKRSGKPVYDLLGGKHRDQATVLWLLADAVLKSDVEAGLAKQDEGFRAFKVKVGVATPEEDLARSKAVCEALGKDMTISADANQGFSLKDGLIYARGAQDAGLDFFEQPIDGTDIAGMTEISKACGIPIGADEGIHKLSDIEIHLKAGAAIGGSLKCIKLGGITQVSKACHLSADKGFHVNIAGKVAETSISGSANVHLALAAPQLDWDMSITSHYLQFDICKNPLKVVNGEVTVSDRPGLGVEVDESKLEQVTYLK